LKTDHFKISDISIALTQIPMMWIFILKYHNKDGTGSNKATGWMSGKR